MVMAGNAVSSPVYSRQGSMAELPRSAQLNLSDSNRMLDNDNINDKINM